uniref:Secreted RxLR effector peptide protein n=1 Tax=Steinernema glaseri TaxID=37863 RepID=A0A1I7ZFI6_9BILA
MTALNDNDDHIHIEWVPILSRRNASDLMKDAFQEVLEDDDDYEAPTKIHRIGDMLSKSYDTIEKEEREGRDRLKSLTTQQYEHGFHSSASAIHMLSLVVTYCLHLLIFKTQG